ncbi:hypothetical protein MKW94_008190 [Papaver nudicaule]|uniref:Uncharacterized protein n=1 Tax=Papaver nudicaule TaxID=74823 RepID=A0AA41VR67_PAPNU|nr:hypothetical protein [Papaver nudicaule]
MPPPAMKLSKQFLRSNASFLLCRENPSKFTGLRKTEPIFMVPPVPGQPKQDDLNPPRMKILERFFIDLVAGDQTSQDRAASRFTSLVGSTDEISLEKRNRAWSELNMCWRKNVKVKGFIMEKVRGGFSVGIAGFIAFMPQKRLNNLGGGMGVMPNRFIIESIDAKKMKIVVTPAQQPFRIRKEDRETYWKPLGTKPLPLLGNSGGGGGGGMWQNNNNNNTSLPPLGNSGGGGGLWQNNNTSLPPLGNSGGGGGLWQNDNNSLFLNRRENRRETQAQGGSMLRNRRGNEYESPSRGLRNGWESQQPAAPMSDKERDGFAAVSRGLLHGWGSQPQRV